MSSGLVFEISTVQQCRGSKDEHSRKSAVSRKINDKCTAYKPKYGPLELCRVSNGHLHQA